MSINVASHGTTSKPASPAFVKQMEARRRESELRPRVHVTTHQVTLRSGLAWVVAMMAYPGGASETATPKGVSSAEEARAAAMAGAAYRRLAKSAEAAAAAIAAERAS